MNTLAYQIAAEFVDANSEVLLDLSLPGRYRPRIVFVDREFAIEALARVIEKHLPPSPEAQPNPSPTQAQPKKEAV